MNYATITADKLSQAIKAWLAEAEVLAPVKRDTVRRFEAIADPSEIDVGPWVTDVPLKELFLPQTECLFHYRSEPGQALRPEPATESDAPRIVFGVRPCDARALTILDHVFLGETDADPYYKARRDRTTLVGLACSDPRSVCFCTSLDGGPLGEDGLDLLLADVGDGYVVKALTPKGRALLTPEFEPAEEASVEAALSDLRAEAEAAMEPPVQTEGLKEKLDAGFSAPVWDRLHEKCIGCGVCAFMCPTCHCFDLADEGDERSGRRIRTWDTCMFSLFTRHASGFNPRPSGKERLRQRLMHNFKYFIDNYQVAACVGCGRCIRNCPVAGDVREAITALQKA